MNELLYEVKIDLSGLTETQATQVRDNAVALLHDLVYNITNNGSVKAPNADWGPLT